MIRIFLVAALGAFALPAHAKQAGETRLMVRPSPAVSATPTPDQQEQCLAEWRDYAQGREPVRLRKGWMVVG